MADDIAVLRAIYNCFNAGRCKIKRTGSRTTRSVTFSTYEIARSPASTSGKITEQAGSE